MKARNIRQEVFFFSIPIYKILPEVMNSYKRGEENKLSSEKPGALKANCLSSKNIHWRCSIFEREVVSYNTATFHSMLLDTWWNVTNKAAGDGIYLGDRKLKMNKDGAA